MTFGQRIKQGRERAGLTQEALAEAVGVSRQAVSKWEAGRARPMADKLARLSAELGIPPEELAAIAAEEAAAGQPPSARPWKIATAALSAALCGVLVLGAVLWPRPAAQPEDVPAGGTPAADISWMFPERLELEAEITERLGDRLLSGGEAAVPDPSFRDTLFYKELPGGTRLMIYRTNPTPENGFTYYDVYAAWSGASTGGGWESLGCLAKYNHYASEGLYGAEYVENVLGHDCWKITLCCGAACVMGWYFTADPETGEVRLLLEAGTPCYLMEADVDSDGEREVVSWGGAIVVYTIYDARPDGRGVVYTLWPDSYSAVPIAFSPENGFAVTDSAGDVKARYLLEENCLKRQPQTDFSLADYPDAAGTDISFLPEGELSDGVDPDQVLEGTSVRITHRQQACLALQALYELTGLKLESVWCMAGKDDLFFCVDDAGDGTGCFYAVTLGRQYGGTGSVTGCSIIW